VQDFQNVGPKIKKEKCKRNGRKKEKVPKKEVPKKVRKETCKKYPQK
jgi:hypothetical protein